MHIGLPTLGLNRTAVAFAVSMLFAAEEPGAHFETYDPNTILQRRNQVTYSEDFSNAAWTQSRVTPSYNTAVNPVNGELTATLLLETADNGPHGVSTSAVSSWVGAPAIGSVYVKAYGGLQRIAVLLDNSGLSYAYFDVVTGALVGTSGSLVNAALCDLEDAGGGWWRINGAALPNSSPRLVVYACQGATNTVSYAGNPANGFYIYGAQYEINVEAPTAYQKVTDWYTEYMAASLNRIGMWRAGISGAATPVTAVEQEVGFWRDTKLGYVSTSHSTDCAAKSKVYAGTGATTISVVSNVVTLTNSPLGDDVKFSGNAEFAATEYPRCEIIVDVTLTAGSVLVYAGSTPTTITASGRYVCTTLGSASGLFIVRSGTSNTTATVSVVSITGYAGNHATQATASSKPTLSARYNLLTKTELMTDAAWVKTDSTVTSGATDPDGGATAFTFTATLTTAQLHHVVASTAGRVRIFAKRRTGSGLFQYWDGAALQSIAVTSSWAEYTLNVTTATVFGCSLYLKTAGDAVDIWHPDLRTVNDAALNQPTYQRVNTATDYDTEGFIHYLKFDGTDDSLQTPAINFSSVDKMTVWAGVTKLSDVVSTIICELGASTAAGTFYIATESSANTLGFSMMGAAVQRRDLISPFSAPVTKVLTDILNTGGATNAEQMQIRADGSAVTPASSTGPTTAGNFGNLAFNIGRRNNASLPFNGRMTSLTVRGSTTPTSTALIRQMEQYSARLAGQSFTSS